jgi:hypothetical protein
MTTTGKLGIPLISSQQNQPEVTHNTAVAMLQALSLGAIALQNAPPGGPSEGDSYIVGDTPTGAWAARANKIATYFAGTWVYIPGNDSNGTPITMGAAQAGLTIYLESELGLVTWDGAHWYGTTPASSD